jgi:hypothetical protein
MSQAQNEQNRTENSLKTDSFFKENSQVEKIELHLDSSQKQDQPDNSYRFTAQEQKDEQGFDDLLQRLSNNARFSYKPWKRQKLMKSFLSADVVHSSDLSEMSVSTAKFTHPIR